MKSGERNGYESHLGDISVKKQLKKKSERGGGRKRRGKKIHM